MLLNGNEGFHYTGQKLIYGWKAVFYDENDSINELNLSARSYNALKLGNILTIGALKEVSDADLREIKNLGAKSIREILEKKEEIEHYFGSFGAEAPAHEIVPSFLGDD